ncbi:hypothetical protein D3Y59_07615 [Hymenobacter oligotrophus]|uniref:Uncharacterized protein n=1 Tax=Hymenobacter oligotrophus TaxID=2319843 RepID=A0A3B7QZ99_9BACT|nr:hypothetical protein [Hymenobacter oligotrophus]AYA36935.1 hypothetical protein D3Y59_07615 [Hymenobacter oligotrophus]
MIRQEDFAALHLELSVKAKNGLDFIAAATLLWAGIAVLWALPGSAAQHSLYTFMASGLMLPSARLLSGVFGTTWTLKHNPLQPLGLWLNFAQLFYFPFLVFMYLRHPEYFIMAYGIITGAHFFPYAWFYRTPAFVVAAGVVAAGSLALGMYLAPTQQYLIPAFISGSLVLLGVWLWVDYRAKARLTAAQPAAVAVA